MIVRRKASTTEDKMLLEQQLQDIMENFDFELVQNYMEQGHRYGEPWKVLVHGKFKVPTVQELRDLAQKQLEEVIERFGSGGYGYIHSGPFKASYRYGILELECVIEFWSCD